VRGVLNAVPIPVLLLAAVALAIAVVVVFSLLVLADLSYPFSGHVAIALEPFDTGTLARFVASSP